MAQTTDPANGAGAAPVVEPGRRVRRPPRTYPAREMQVRPLPGADAEVLSSGC